MIFSSISSKLSSGPSTLTHQAIQNALKPLTAQLSKIKSDVKSSKDKLKSDWYILKSQMMDIIHPASKFASMIDDAKKGEKGDNQKVKGKKKEKKEVKGKGKGIKIAEPTGGKIQTSVRASSIEPEPASDRLTLAKAGEAQKYYEDKQKQIQEDHELALMLEKEEEAELQKEKEKEKAKLKDDNTKSPKPNTKKKVLRKVRDIEEEDEAKRKEEQEIIQMPRNFKSKITNVSITPKSKKVLEMLITISSQSVNGDYGYEQS